MFYAVKWLSHCALNFATPNTKKLFREIEKENKNLVNNQEHCIFNEIYAIHCII